jgi:DNA-binding CsgD family transcriptional regulator
MLRGRRAECERLDELIDAVRLRQSRALVICGETGIGKSALLEYLVSQASGCRVIRVAGVQAEAELAFAGLHQLCGPLLDRLERIPAPQYEALTTAFGLRAGCAPDQFLLGLAVLSLLAEAADERPLVCVIDDAQWLDRTSVQALAFVARRLAAESVALVFALPDPAEEHLFDGLEQLVLGGLQAKDARELLASAIPGPLDERVRDRIIAEMRGNPLALLELPQGLTYAELAGGFGLPGVRELSDRIEANFRRRIAALSPRARRLLLVAAAEPTGNSALVGRAASRLGIMIDKGDPVAFAGLLEWGPHLTFRHPLARSAIYREAAAGERRVVHRALAEVTDPAVDADRRAWHLAHAASGPDEDVAAELERSADRARARGGLAAAAAFLERAAVLTPDPAQRARRALAAANTKLQAGAFDAALDLIAMAATGPLNELDQARVELLGAQLAFITHRGGDAPLLLVKAAKRLEPVDVDLARMTYLDALSAALYAGQLANPGGDAREMARAAGAAPRPLRAPRAPDLLLDGLAANFNQGYAAGVPILRQALTDFGSGMSVDEELRWMWLANGTAFHLWDDERWDVLSERYVQLARTSGALSELPLALSRRAYMLLFAGDFRAVASLVDERQAVAEAIGSNLVPYAAMGLAALSGRQTEAAALIESALKDVTSRGEGIGIAVAQWANAVLNNSLGNYSEAMAAAQHALNDQRFPDAWYPGAVAWAAIEFIEAAARSGLIEAATETFSWVAVMTGASHTDWGIGLEARLRALISGPEHAEPYFREAIDRLGRTRMRTELARARLLYGEWLRRQRRRLDAREQLRAALEMFSAMGAEGFANRARRELNATGETARRSSAPTISRLTAREVQIARMAREGHTNPEIGIRLFLSPRTVEYHLGNAFAKLGITSRHELGRALSAVP